MKEGRGRRLFARARQAKALTRTWKAELNSRLNVGQSNGELQLDEADLHGTPYGRAQCLLYEYGVRVVLNVSDSSQWSLPSVVLLRTYDVVS